MKKSGMMIEQDLIRWAQQIQAHAQSGMAYTTNAFEQQRFQELRRIAAEMMTAATRAELEEVTSVFDTQSGYATPKLDVRGVVFKENKILMVRELMDGGNWTLPGGWVDINEPLSKAAEREVREEAGMIVKATKIAAVFDKNLHGHPPYPFHIYKMFVLCDLIAEATPDPLETSDPTFFGADHIPTLSRARVTEEEIQRMFAHLKNPELPTEFD
jgi:ADP-ribose pyrophosphatase YjhB (NUDIX family)